MDLDKVNALLRQATETIGCDMDCQNANKKKELEKIFLDAKNDVVNAPLKLKIAAKNYYEFSSGDVGYNEYLDKELTAEAIAKTTEFENKFNTNAASVERSIELLDGLALNRENIVDSLKTFEEKNEELSEEISDTENDTLMDERKMFYEEEGISGLGFYYNVMWFFYYAVLIIFVVLNFTNVSVYSLRQRIAIFILLAIYPYFASKLLNWFLKIVEAIKNILPKNSRLDL